MSFSLKLGIGKKVEDYKKEFLVGQQISAIFFYDQSEERGEWAVQQPWNLQKMALILPMLTLYFIRDCIPALPRNDFRCIITSKPGCHEN